MALIVVGSSHRTAPIAVRERFALGASEVGRALERLRDAAGVREGVVLSTCNRTEFYLVEGEPDEAGAATAEVAALLAERLGEAAEPYLYVRRDRDAARHLFRVASGLDAMILGEAQIHGQVRDAWERSRESSGAVLNRLFQSALLVGGRLNVFSAPGEGTTIELTMGAA